MALLNASLTLNDAAKPTRANLRSCQDEYHLIRQILSGKSERFQELVKPHLPVVSSVVRHKMGNHVEVEDVLQEALLKAFTRLPQFRFEANFRTWFTQIAINESRQWYRRPAQSRYSRLEDCGMEAGQVPDGSPSPFDIYIQKEREKQIHRAIACLPEKYRTVIRLRELHNLSIADTARALRLTVAAVKTRHRRARLYMFPNAA